jgi:predicted component of viral defense system (DUF524 family)
VSEFAEAVACGPYKVIAQNARTLAERPDGTVELYAEHSYLVKLEEGADEGVLRGALTVPKQGSEGELRFENYFGLAELGGRRLIVRSNRLDPEAVPAMLDEVSDWLSSLPFSVDIPVKAAYTRERDASPEVLYHAFSLVRDAMHDRGPHRLRGTIERILSRPHESLSADQPRLVPLGAANSVDAETVDGIASAPELLRPVAPDSPLAHTPVAKKLRGSLPDFVRVRPFRHSTDTVENQFVAGALDSMIDLLRRFERHERAASRPSAAANVRESREISDYLSRSRRHRVLDGIRPIYEAPQQSTILRARPGYRDLLRLHADLRNRARASEPHDMQRLLELRDAAAIYELWCYIQVVRALEGLLGTPRCRDRFETSTLQAEVRWGYKVEWEQKTAIYNESFPHAAADRHRQGFDSYSLTLRPDITLRDAAGRVNLFDAKLKRRLKGVVTSADGEEIKAADTFKPEDLHKMHAYRDALGADSVWVLFPGQGTEMDEYVSPQPGPPTAKNRFQGVGAIPLRPGAEADGGLLAVLKRIL